MNVAIDRALIAISVTAEVLEYRIRGETKFIVNSAECFPYLIESAAGLKPSPTFLVESVGGWETGIVHALQVARQHVCVVESSAIQKHFALADAAEVDVEVVSRYGELMRDTHSAARRVDRILSAYAPRPRDSRNWWQRLLGTVARTSRPQRR